LSFPFACGNSTDQQNPSFSLGIQFKVVLLEFSLAPQERMACFLNIPAKKERNHSNAANPPQFSV